MSNYSTSDSDSAEDRYKKMQVMVPQKKEKRSVSRWSHKEPVSKPDAAGAVNGKLKRVLLLVCAAAMLPLLALSYASRLPSQDDVQKTLNKWIPGAHQDEITIMRDPATRRWGIHYSDSLMLTRVDEGSSAKSVNLDKFVGRRITNVNGVAVYDAGQFQSLESRLDGDSITLRFAPSEFAIGTMVKVMKRINFRTSGFIEQGTTGIVVRFPGEIQGSIASVKTGTATWDALPGQIEPLQDHARLAPGNTIRTVKTIVFKSRKRIPSGSIGVVISTPGEVKGSVAFVKVGGFKWDAMPGQIELVNGATGIIATPPPAPLATEEVVHLLDALGHQEYLSRLAAYGVDRLDFLATATKQDGVILGIKPQHWKRIVTEAKQRLPKSGRGRLGLEQLLGDLGEKQLLPRLLRNGFDRLDQLAKSAEGTEKDLQVKPAKWKRIRDEAQHRMNMTKSGLEQPQTQEHQRLYRLLQDVGLQKHYRRLIVFGLDSLDRMAKSQNISVTIELPGWEWDRIVNEAQRRVSGKAPIRMASGSDPDSEKDDLLEHEALAQKYEAEDTTNAEKHEARPKAPKVRSNANRGKDEVGTLDKFISSAVHGEEEERTRFNEMLRKAIQNNGS